MLPSGTASLVWLRWSAAYVPALSIGPRLHVVLTGCSQSPMALLAVVQSMAMPSTPGGFYTWCSAS